jgi:hypothetical protein
MLEHGGFGPKFLQLINDIARRSTRITDASDSERKCCVKTKAASTRFELSIAFWEGQLPMAFRPLGLSLQ